MKKIILALNIMGCWNGAQWATVIAVGLSSAMLIICLTLVGQMRQDMSNLYTEFMDDMQEFNVSTKKNLFEFLSIFKFNVIKT